MAARRTFWLEAGSRLSCCTFPPGPATHQGVDFLGSQVELPQCSASVLSEKGRSFKERETSSVQNPGLASPSQHCRTGQGGQILTAQH